MPTTLARTQLNELLESQSESREVEWRRREMEWARRENVSADERTWWQKTLLEERTWWRETLMHWNLSGQSLLETREALKEEKKQLENELEYMRIRAEKAEEKLEDRMAMETARSREEAEEFGQKSDEW